MPTGQITDSEDMKKKRFLATGKNATVQAEGLIEVTRQ
jgi:hypothetical protein